MDLELRIKVKRFERYWKKEGRKKLFIGIYRYLRLHRELLTDSLYQEMFDYHRKTLIAYFKRDTKDKKTSDQKCGEVVDFLADMSNQNGAENANKYKWVVEMLYEQAKEIPVFQCDIRI